MGPPISPLSSTTGRIMSLMASLETREDDVAGAKGATMLLMSKSSVLRLFRFPFPALPDFPDFPPPSGERSDDDESERLEAESFCVMASGRRGDWRSLGMERYMAEGDAPGWRRTGIWTESLPRLAPVACGGVMGGGRRSAEFPSDGMIGSDRVRVADDVDVDVDVDEEADEEG